MGPRRPVYRRISTLVRARPDRLAYPTRSKLVIYPRAILGIRKLRPEPQDRTGSAGGEEHE